MNILLISYEFPPVGGGTGKAVYYIAREFIKIGHKVGVLTLRFKDQPAEENIEGIQIFRIPALRKKLHESNPFEIGTFSLSGLFNAAKVADKFKPDISLAYFTIPSGIVSLWLEKTRKIPFLTLLRGQDVPGWMPGVLKKYHALCKPLIKHIWRKSNKVIANSAGLQQMAGKTLPDIDIRSIPNGIDPERYSPKEKDNKEVSIFFSGRLREQKGLSYLFEGVRLLKEMGVSGFHLKIAGTGPEEENLKNMVKEKGIEDKIRFLEYLDEENLIKEYRSSDVFINPSLNEGMPNAVLEAMACALPCVVTDVEGNNELIKDGVNGLVVEAKNPQALSDALKKLIDNSALRKDMGERGRGIAVNNFTWNKTAKNIINIAEQQN